jgi:hypothetical protein
MGVLLIKFTMSDVLIDKAAAWDLAFSQSKAPFHAKLFRSAFLFCFNAYKIWHVSSQSFTLVNLAMPPLTI